MKYKLLLLALATTLSAKYANCDFKNPHYEDVCKAVVKKGVSYQYANEFLSSYFKTKKFDEESWKLMQPSKLEYHKKQEKKANNALVAFLPKMVAHLKEYKEVYDYAEETYGVNREVIAAILLKETRLGVFKPKHDAFIVFNTMVVRTKGQTPREKWILKMGKTNMTTIIHYCYEQGLAPEQCNFASSYAGAVGIPQFMPDNFIYANSYKGELPDLTRMEDAIVSAANYLNKRAAFDTLIEWEKMRDVPTIEQEWYEYEFTNKNASFVYETSKSGENYSCFTKEKPELDYLKEKTQKIMRYNNSSNYALGVLSLAYQAHYQLNQ